MRVLFAFIFLVFQTLAVRSLRLKPIFNLPKWDLQVESLYPCKDEPDVRILFENIVVNKAGQSKFTITGTIKIRETLEDPTNMVMKMYKCGNKDDFGTCEYYFTVRRSQICESLKSPIGDTWGSFRKGTDLPENCPYKPGVFNITKAEIDLNDLSKLPLFNVYWKIQTRMFHNGKLFICMWNEFSVREV